MDKFDSEIWLTDCIARGATGQVFNGTAGNETYAIKIAPWKEGRKML
jgi:hypothetical protein